MWPRLDRQAHCQARAAQSPGAPTPGADEINEEQGEIPAGSTDCLVLL